MPKPNLSLRYSPWFHKLFRFFKPNDKYKEIELIAIKIIIKSSFTNTGIDRSNEIDKKSRIFLSVLDKILSVKCFNGQQLALCFTLLEELEKKDKSKEEGQSTKQKKSYLDYINQITYILKDAGQLNFRAFNVIHKKMLEIDFKDLNSLLMVISFLAEKKLLADSAITYLNCCTNFQFYISTLMIKSWLKDDERAINQLLRIAPHAIEEIYENQEVTDRDENREVYLVNHKVLHQLLDKYEKEQPLRDVFSSSRGVSLSR